jgi:hypothetical protein
MLPVLGTLLSSGPAAMSDLVVLQSALAAASSSNLQSLQLVDFAAFQYRFTVWKRAKYGKPAGLCRACSAKSLVQT